MIETRPFEDLSEREPAPGPDAKTVELTPGEVIEALAAYIRDRHGENFKGHVIVETRIEDDKLRTRVTYWRTDESTTERKERG